MSPLQRRRCSTSTGIACTRMKGTGCVQDNTPAAAAAAAAAAPAYSLHHLTLPPPPQWCPSSQWSTTICPLRLALCLRLCHHHFAQLTVSYSTHREVNIRSNNDRNWDFMIDPRGPTGTATALPPSSTMGGGGGSGGAMSSGTGAYGDAAAPGAAVSSSAGPAAGPASVVAEAAAPTAVFGATVRMLEGAPVLGASPCPAAVCPFSPCLRGLSASPMLLRMSCHTPCCLSLPSFHVPGSRMLLGASPHA
jgi:hypothetical protein